MRIVYSPQARADLQEVRQYIAENLQNPQAAQKLTDRIVRSAHLLAQQPNLGIGLREKVNRDTDYRCLICGNYGVFYLPFEDEEIRIVRILDLRTDYMCILFAE